jgi:hypothetical protein
MNDNFWRCIWFEKRITKDSYKHGCDPSTSRILRSEDHDICSPTLKGLIDVLGNRFDLSLDDLFLPTAPATGVITGFSFNRLENDHGNEPDRNELAAFRRGELELWLADYSFTIEHLLVATVTVTREDFQAANIKFHE